MSFGRAKSGIERRQFGRRETGYSAWIRVAGKPSQACVVRNLTDGGALLECSYPRLLPFRFVLDIPALGGKYRCEARHCGDTALGVEFLGSEQHDNAPTSKAAQSGNAGTWGTQTGERQVRLPQHMVGKPKA